jgi:hypothetical protein
MVIERALSEPIKLEFSNPIFKILNIEVDGFTFFGEPSTYKIKRIIVIDGDKYFVSHGCPANSFAIDKVIDKFSPEILEVKAKEKFYWDNASWGNPNGAFSDSTAEEEYPYYVGGNYNSNNEHEYFVDAETAKKIGIYGKQYVCLFIIERL